MTTHAVGLCCIRHLEDLHLRSMTDSGHGTAENSPDRHMFQCVLCAHSACADTNATASIHHLGRHAQATGGRPRLPCCSALLKVGGNKRMVAVRLRKRPDQDLKPRPSGQEAVMTRLPCNLLVRTTRGATNLFLTSVVAEEGKLY